MQSLDSINHKPPSTLCGYVENHFYIRNEVNLQVQGMIMAIMSTLLIDSIDDVSIYFQWNVCFSSCSDAFMLKLSHL